MIFAKSILKDRRYLVTGSTGGAGQATAKLIAECGGLVTVMGRDPERTEKVKRSLAGGGHVSVICDWRAGAPVGFPAHMFDGIFHASGEEQTLPTGMLRSDGVDRLFASSIYAAFTLSALVGARASILKDGGAFVMMSSVAAVCGTSGMTVYAASKGAIESLVRSAAIEWAPRRIRVNAIRAGGFQSPMHARIAARATPDAMNDYAQRHPLGFGKSDDVAQIAVFLLSDAGKWVTGACWTADGGYSAK